MLRLASRMPFLVTRPNSHLYMSSMLDNWGLWGTLDPCSGSSLLKASSASWPYLRTPYERVLSFPINILDEIPSSLGHLFVVHYTSRSWPSRCGVQVCAAKPSPDIRWPYHIEHLLLSTIEPSLEPNSLQLCLRHPWSPFQIIKVIG